MEAEERSEMLSVAPEGAMEGMLIDARGWGAVRALWERGVSKKAIARELDLDVKTVRKWCRQAWSPQKRRSRGRGWTAGSRSFGDERPIGSSRFVRFGLSSMC
jgi:hypothetical protein